MALIGILIYGFPFLLIPVVFMIFFASVYGKRSGDGCKTRMHYIAKLCLMSIAVTFVNTPFAVVFFSWMLGSYQSIQNDREIVEFIVETLKETHFFALVLTLLISPIWLLAFFWAETTSDKFEKICRRND